MRHTTLLFVALALPLRADDLGLKVPPGFRVTLWADHTLANDIYTMALDEKGHVVVSGPGYVRRLEDTDGDGRADKATDIAPTKSGAMGLCFTTDVVTDRDFNLNLTSDGRAAALAWHGLRGQYVEYRTLLKPFPFSEHGGHALKLGPDRQLYAVGGNDSKLAGHSAPAGVPADRVEAGGIVRLVRTTNSAHAVIAHGFRNPYDFDFTPYGDIITFDSDTERDYLLPWYAPTRVYHVLPGGHHGWRLPGYQRSLRRPDYFPDTVAALADMGRGSPTGVCCYRHTQFPKHYRGGVFLLDWTFGKIHYLPLIPDGSSYKQVPPEVFLEPTGMNGFAPTAARVAPDGSLFVSIGGRGTRGGVYRIEYRVRGEALPIPPAGSTKDIDRVLNAPQPLEAWSIARWQPLVDRIDVEEFRKVARDESEVPIRRLRSIEALVRFKAGISSNLAQALLQSRSAMVRARLGWALGVSSSSTAAPTLWTLAGDRDPRVRVEALSALQEVVTADPHDPRVDIKTLRECLAHPDRRVRLSAAQIVSRVLTNPDARRATNPWRSGDSPLWQGADSRTLVSLILAFADIRDKELAREAGLAAAAWKALDTAESTGERLEALRAVMLVMGDWNLNDPKVELVSAYSPSPNASGDSAYFRLASRSRMSRLLEAFPSADEGLNIETARLFAMLESDDPVAVRKCLDEITADSHPTRDFHFLTVLTRLSARRTEEQTRRVADALLRMEKKLAGRQLRIKQNWAARFGELTGELLRVHPGLDPLVAAHPNLVQPGHVVVAARLAGNHRREAARRFLDVIREDAEFPMSVELIDLVSGLPAADYRPVFRARWSDRSLREAIAGRLTERPEPADRERFLEALETAGPDVTLACVQALETLPRDESPKNLVPLLIRLRQALSEPKESRVRKSLVDLVNRQAGQGFRISESRLTAVTLAGAYRPVFEWFEKAHPAETKLLNADGEDAAAIRTMLPAVKWDAGDLERGRKLFRDRGCQTCHGGSARLGPDLAGVGRRLSREDLLTSLLSPSRDVAPAYRVTNVDLKDGHRLTGIVVFESADGLMVQTGATETRRVATENIENRTWSPKSLMPDGLLKGLRPEDLADLFAFLGQQ